MWVGKSKMNEGMRVRWVEVKGVEEVKRIGGARGGDR